MKKVLLMLLLLGGCTLFDDKPDHSCKTNADCFQAQGEHCDATLKQCVTVDAAP